MPAWRGPRARRTPLQRLAPWFVHALLACLIAHALAGLALQRANTLHHNGRWESGKVGLDYGILGAVSFLTTRTALHRAQLDLGVWHGYQEVVHAEPVALERLDLKFQLGRAGYVVVLHEKRDDGFLGVRLSRSEGLPSACLEGSASGRFDRREPLAVGPLDDRWHAVSIVAAGDRYRVELDGEPVGECGVPAGVPVRFGVRGSAAKKIYVDDVEATLAGGERIVEDFSNHRSEAAVWLAALGGVLAVQGLVLAIGARRRREEGVSVHVAVLAVHAVLLACAGLAWATEALYLGRLHPDEVDFAGYENRIEYEFAVTTRLAREFPAGPPAPGVRRILAVGTSQTWGSGAVDEAGTWVARVERGLNEGARDGERFEVINTGIPGQTGPILLPIYLEQWLVWQPEAVLINLGNNDRDPQKLAATLEVFVDLHEERGIRTIFVPEPNTVENRGSLHKLEARHAAMREVAARRGIPVIEVHGPLAERRDEGFVWWDRVHLTAFGHELFAEILLDEREKLLGPAG